MLNASLHTNGARSSFGELARLLLLYPPGETADQRLLQLSAYATDFKFICQAKAYAAAVQGSPRRRGPVFLYRYNHAYAQSSCTDLYFRPAFGVTHTAEVSFVFGAPQFIFGAPATSAPSLCAFTPEEQAISDALGGLWAAFAREGVPHSSWPPYMHTTDTNALLDAGLGRGGSLPTESHWRRGFCA